MIYLTNVNLNQNELQNAVIQPLAVAPSNPKLGQIYTDSTNSRIKWWNGVEWKVVGVVVESSTANGAIKVDGVDMTVYTLPKATATVLGGIKLGSGLVATEDGIVSVDVVNNLTTDDATKPLSAAMGKSLKDSINKITTDIGDLGGGDMMKATYDANGDGVVDDAEKLGGQLPSYYAPASSIPTKLSDLTNDEEFIDKSVSNLVNYYLKSETYTQAEVNALIGNLATIQVLIPESGVLPATGKSNIIYLIPKSTADGEQNTYDEYLWTGTKFERIGDTTIDLSNYLTKTGDASNTTVTFTQADSRTNIVTGESMNVILGKVAKYLADLKPVAFSGSYQDLEGTPDIVKYATFSISTAQTSNSVEVAGTKVLAVTVVDTTTKEVVLCDVDINGKTVTVSVSTNPTNSLEVTVSYI